MASDGSIKIEISVDGKEVKVASKELDNLEASAGGVGKGIKSAESSMDGLADSSDKAGKSVKGAKESIDGVGQGTTKASISLKDLAVSLGLVAVASAAFNTLKASMDGAISRFDTLNTFPKVLEGLGVSAEDSERAINNLSEGIDGLPTTLDDISSSAQQMYNSFKDVDKTTDTALALNNALLASGSAGEKAKRGTDQYIKALQTGQINMDTWNTLQETMGIGLTKLAEEFGYAGASAENDLYQALKNGEVTFDQFNSKLIELGTGTGELAELAKTNSLGIATSLGNLKNAAARGIADIIASFNKLSEDVTNKGLAENIDTLKHIVNASFKAIGSAIEATAPVVKVFGSAVQAVLPVVQALTPVLIGLATAYAFHTTVLTVTAALKANAVVMAVVTAAQKAYTIATNGLTLSLTLAATRMKIVGVALAAYNSIVALSTTVQAAFTTGMTLANVAALVLSGGVTILGTAIKVMMGPIGWVTLAIGALVGAVIGIVKWFNKSSEEADRLTAETEELGESVNSLTESVSSNANAYKESVSSIESTSKANADLVQRIQELSEKENKSAADKLLLKDSIEQLNGSVDGLNLSYNEEANALNMSSEQLSARLQLMQDMETTTAGQERLLEISKEQNEVDLQLSEINELREEWLEKMENGEVKSKDYAAALAELQEKEDALKVTVAELAEQFGATEEQIAAAMEGIATSTEENVALQLLAFSEISDANKQFVEDMMSKWQEYKDAATDMFDTISDKVTVTAGEMASNLEENQRVISQWADNIATLSERGIDEGLLETLRAAGPESAGHVNALVNASDEELQRLSTAFAEGGDVATDALSKSLGIEGSGVMEAVGELVENTTTTMKQQIEAADFNAIGKSMPEGAEIGFKEGTPDVVKAATDMVDETVNETKNALETNSPSKVFTDIGESAPEGMTLGINNGTPKAIEAAKKLAVELLKPFDKTPADFKRIGEEAMAGFNRGLNAGKAQVLSTATSIANQAAQTMRKALDIHSPSRVTETIGKQTGEGFTKGIKGQGKKASKAAEKVAKEAAKKLKETLDHSKRFIDDKKYFNQLSLDEELKAWERVQGRYKKGTKERIEAEKNVYRIKKEIEKHGYEASKAFIDKRKYYDQMSLREELSAWERIQARYKKGTKEREEAERNIYRLKKELQKEEYNNSKKWIDEKKYYNELSLKEELDAWERVQSRYVEGTEERKEADREVYRVKKEINDQLLKMNDDYFKRVQDINKKLIEDEKKLNEEYSQTHSKRVDELKNFVGLLDEFVETDYVSGYQLIHNMQTQVDALEEFSSVMGSLGDRIDNDALFKELQALGPKSIAELRELNDMSEEELTEFTRLYEKRFELARNQANKELEPLKDDITQQIKDLNEASQKELLLVEKEWKKSIQKIILGTQKEFGNMDRVGKDAMRGLESGILSMESSLMATTKRIADSIKATMQSALDINSPSRVMREEVGRWIPEGIALGIKDNAKSVYKELENMAGKMIMPASPEQALGAFKKQSVGGYGVTNNSSKTSYDHSKKMENHINIEAKDSGVKELERVIRRLQFGL